MTSVNSEKTSQSTQHNTSAEKPLKTSIETQTTNMDDHQGRHYSIHSIKSKRGSDLLKDESSDTDSDTHLEKGIGPDIIISIKRQASAVIEMRGSCYLLRPLKIEKEICKNVANCLLTKMTKM